MRYLKISKGVLTIEQTEKPLTLEQLQAHVGGYIELPISRSGLALYCNEEGKLHGLAPNVHVPELQDTIVGDVIIVAENKRTEQCEMTDAQMRRVRIHKPIDDVQPVLLMNGPALIGLGVEITYPRLEIL